MKFMKFLVVLAVLAVVPFALAGRHAQDPKDVCVFTSPADLDPDALRFALTEIAGAEVDMVVLGNEVAAYVVGAPRAVTKKMCDALPEDFHATIRPVPVSGVQAASSRWGCPCYGWAFWCHEEKRTYCSKRKGNKCKRWKTECTCYCPFP